MRLAMIVSRLFTYLPARCRSASGRAMQRFAACLLAWVLALPAMPVPADQGQETIRLGSYSGARREWSRAEVLSTFDLWAQELARQFQVPVSFIHYDDPLDLRRDFQAGKLHGVNADAMTFVRLFKPEELAEGYATIMKGGWDLMLFAGRDASVADLGDLAGKRIVLLEENPVGDLYLETLCLRHHQRPCKAVFADFQRVTTSNQALMRVFFGKADLALVHGYGHALAVEMNPQLGHVLRKLAEYPVRSLFFAFYSIKVDKALRQRTVRVTPTLHTYPRGRQLLDIFKIDHLEIAHPADLQPVIDLERDYQSLLAQAERKAKRK
jgi:hypothetical protein